MRAAILRDNGAPEVLGYGDLPTPVPGPVRSSCACWQPGSTASTIMPGYLLDAAEAGFRPIIAAQATSSGVSPSGAPTPSAWSCRSAGSCATAPGSPPAEAATLLIPVVTGVRAVKIVGYVKEGDLVLVHAGASGTGSINVQIARALGTRAAATIRTPEKAGFVRDLGAELVVPTNEDDFVSAVRDWSEGRGVSAVIDNLGGEVLTRSLDCLTPLGRLMSMGFVAGMGATIQIRPFFFAQRQIRGTLMGDVEDLEWGLEQVRRGRIRPRPWITPSRSPKRPRRTRTSRRRRAAAPCSCSGKKPDLLNVSNGSEHRLLRDLGADGV